MSALFTLYYLGAALGQGRASLGKGAVDAVILAACGTVWAVSLAVTGAVTGAVALAMNWAAVLAAKAWARRLTISCDRSTP